MSLLEVKDLCKRFAACSRGQRQFTVAAGSIKGSSANGAGKTTLFNLIFGALLPDSARCGSTPADRWLQPHQVVAAGMARTFQHIRLFPR